MSDADAVQAGSARGAIPADVEIALASSFTDGRNEMAAIGEAREEAAETRSAGRLISLGALAVSGVVVGVATTVVGAAASVGVGAAVAAAAVPVALVGGTAAVAYGVYKYARGYFQDGALDERANEIETGLGVDPREHTAESYLDAVPSLEPQMSETSRGDLRYEIAGVLHREDGPALERANGTREWYRYGELHRDDGPAVELENGGQVWYRDGARHRVDGPAVEWRDGPPESDLDRYRADLPRLPGRVDERWYLDGEEHRDGGPSTTFPNGDMAWSTHGERTAYYDAKSRMVDHMHDGQRHRDDGPARVYLGEDTARAHSWYRHGQAHYPSGLALELNTPSARREHYEDGPGRDPCADAGAQVAPCGAKLHPFTLEGAAALSDGRASETSMYAGKLWVDHRGIALPIQPQRSGAVESPDVADDAPGAPISAGSPARGSRDGLLDELSAVARQRARVGAELASFDTASARGKETGSTPSGIGSRPGGLELGAEASDRAISPMARAAAQFSPPAPGIARAPAPLRDNAMER